MQINNHNRKIINAKPFLKWAGGKTQLLAEFEKRLPAQVIQKKSIEQYIEPFVGAGAMFFFLKRNYKIKQSFLFDINKELIIGYKSVQNDYKELINELRHLEENYRAKTEEDKKDFYYNIRNIYNKQMDNFNYDYYDEEWIERTSYLIFMNKTGYNGLFRQNKKGKFNVPHGRHKNPTICDEENITKVNKALKDTEIFCGDFTKSYKYIQENSFVYLDPPYHPLNKTSHFTDYSKEGFNEKDQERLADFFKKMDKKGAYLMLSNSDPKNENPEDNFFDNLYKNYNIERVPAKRHINSNASKRGEINELVIRNYL